MPLLSQRLPQPAAAGSNGVRGLILIHGCGCNRGIWSAWMKPMRRLEIPCITVDLEPLFGPIDDCSGASASQTDRGTSCSPGNPSPGATSPWRPMSSCTLAYSSEKSGDVALKSWSKDSMTK